MSSNIAIQVKNISKCYQIYGKPQDRLKQSIFPRLQKLVGRNETKFYLDHWAVRDISFEVMRGESVGILGRNGSGKSTLLQLITGNLSPTAGSIEVNGRVTALLELGAGFNPEFSGRENVYLNGALLGFTQKQLDERFDCVASFADIGQFIDQPVRTYSSGMYARLAFASAIHSEPDVLIVDEILAVGDAPFQQKCMKHLYRMLDAGVSILLVSHDAYQVRAICQKALLLEKGSQRMFDVADRVMNEYIASIGMAAEVNPAEPPEIDKEIVEEEVSNDFSVSIHDPSLVSGDLCDVSEISSHQQLNVEFKYRIHGRYEGFLTFVVNLYREDDVYIFGATTKMQGYDEFMPASFGRVRVNFPTIPLVSGRYKFRVAINDGRGLSILAEAVPVCNFSVIDDFRAVGIVDLPHKWTHSVLVCDTAPPRSKLSVDECR